ncbi:MAG: serine--tRNA ligase [Candidatus Zambryskibacteria bacterium RIFCSPHIGHO2_02_FULL_43_14]|uniref:Serine--tRNA ligase n=1 Tax=Candidatus Zambryskibacteria bacterium RIFCSPHIGHO2_02_FULL_43_14 TaxID=1802748 RepID=A0A1G2TIB9_9BACT|nr:MAG: serine--tRNA ligase [Candidatus Zambryskibacteria bacterium RIFCSPHIGHO2_01_FULL_43_60]OHA96943.1 MAG: serine--tRNA ligase [Candidatus Zambryskibacteria bacterium RIFCSPHIGHO2_02_FULL_43_14]OHB03965.1 MAG: serine--tRNA ligase [Candidatus Zambryskibacteria bacterium RIFCSPLOWO2_01_FULL_42_41]
MLDIKFIRENKELIQQAAKKKQVEFDVDKLIEVDDKRKILLGLVEEKRAEQKVSSNTIVKANSEEREIILEKMKILKGELEREEENLKKVLQEWQTLMLSVPNVPDTSVPDGEGEKDNVTIKEWGNKPKFSFIPKDHIEIMTALDMVDFERGAKVHGFRGYFLKNSGVLLSWAIWNYAQHFFLQRNFVPFIAPSIVRKNYFYGTGHLPTDAEDLYKTQDDDYLSGTAEVPMMAYHADEILKKEELPKRYLAFSPCYRREAGSYSKDTKGLIRVHEFFKLEQLILCEASHAESEKLHEELNRNTEEFIESLSIPYRQVVISTGDLKKAHVKSYDTELWVPAQNTYREIASASYYHDFQTRRFNIRYDDDGKKLYTHSLNATAAPTPRLLVSLIENFQQADGSIKIPEVLVPYMNGLSLIKK